MKKLFILFLIQIGVFYSLLAATPKWITEPYSVYSRNDYIVAVGEGSTKLSAQNKALNGIATFFGQSVKSKIIASETYKKNSTNDKESSKNISTLIKDIGITVNQDDLLGIEYPEFYQDKKNDTWYVIGVMNLKKACELYTKKINNNEKLIKALLQYDNKGSLIYISRLRKARSISIENEKMNLRIFFMDPNRIQKISKASEIEAELQSISEKLPIYIHIENDDGIISSYCTELLKNRAFNITNEEEAVFQMNGTVEYLYSEKKDHNISFCELIFNSQLIDVNSSNIYVPLNITIREGSITKELARNRALNTLKKRLDEAFTF
ncbi:MAG: LPP20 family lipoprotein [Treponema sp.]|nr:LPP20 family lipoprotein [Treponema sp.]